MGLDVVAYARCAYVGETLGAVRSWQDASGVALHWTERGEPDDGKLLRVTYLEGFPHAGVGSPEGYYYAAEEARHFRAGSYTWYNSWRDWLARWALKTPAAHVWRHPETYRETPFFELINFSDCEGWLAAAACAALRDDFTAHRAAAQAADGRDAHTLALYQHFAEAFTYASDRGFVSFC